MIFATLTFIILVLYPRAIEGCVDVSHLRGYFLHYKRHVRSPVLCVDFHSDVLKDQGDFCATPNHGIIVKGKYTCMREMCTDKGAWNCSMDLRWVNNLKSHINNRAVGTNGIVITAFDVRLPKVLIWVLHILQDLVTLGCMFILIATVFHSASKLHSIEVEEKEN